jgi:RNA polymerase sigma factor (sigma-70 family)
MPELRSAVALDAWLVRAALSAALDRIKSEVARARREAQHVNAPGFNEHALAQQLRAEIDRLEPDDRDAITLRYVHGRSLDAVAVVLGIGSKAAESRVRRALNRLRSRLTEVKHG